MDKSQRKVKRRVMAWGLWELRSSFSSYLTSRFADILLGVRRPWKEDGRKVRCAVSELCECKS